jgi:ABC-type nickel/cobalt efflux system permease component RcnA
MNRSQSAAEPDQPRRSRWWIAAAAALVLLAIAGWSIWRHEQDYRWDTQAIAAQFRDVTVQRQDEKDVHLLLHYALTNSTHHNYRLASPPLGVLMQRRPEGALKEMDSVIWDSIVIPAGKTVIAEFDVSLQAVQDLASPEEIHSAHDLQAFAGHELSGIRGLVFWDYGNRYWIELPRGWQ